MLVFLSLLSCKTEPAEVIIGDDTDADTTPDTPADTGDTPADDTADTGDEFGLSARPENPGCLAPDRPATDADVTWVPAYGALSFFGAVQMVYAPDAARWLVVQQEGLISAFDDDASATEAEVLLDLSAVVKTNYESGLLGMAFHPEFNTNREVFLSYSGRITGGQTTVIARFTTDDDLVIDPDSEEVVFSVDQPAYNHNGGQIAFGPDGMLYISLGDGGGAGDIFGNGQDTDTVLGAILRIDVDSGDPYVIPTDNPFVDGGGAAEIYAWGLRNPWRFVFDQATGGLWVGDVGQNDSEEIDLIALGGNYGWPTREGSLCYAEDPCDGGGLIDPVAEYDRSDNASVIMGPVYRGAAIPELVGTPLFTDFYDGELRGVTYDELTGEPEVAVLAGATGESYAFFAEDADGEVFTIDYYTGRIRQLVPATSGEPDAFPRLLSETGCVDPTDPAQPAEGLIPYGVAHPFWSDGAEKERWLALPDGLSPTIESDGTLTLPVGSVVVKHFDLAGERVETRLMVRHEDGAWAGYSYAWEGGDATYAAGGSSAEINGQTWPIPSSADCLRCHTDAAGHTLGLSLSQLAGSFTYPSGIEADQLGTWAHIGLIEEADAEPLAALGEGDVADQARAYLDVNCSVCHRPGGPGGGSLDLRVDTPLSETGACDVSPEQGDLGIDNARLIAPGDPARSLIAARMATLDAQRMPPLGSSVVDEDGLAAVEAWIEGLSGCE